MTSLVLPALLCCASAASAVLLDATPSHDTLGVPVAAVFPPWWSAAEAIGAASRVGRIVRLSAVPFVVVVADETPIDVPAERPVGTISDRLRAVGAAAVVDPLVSGGCAPPEPAA